eukprot:gene827-398_t
MGGCEPVVTPLAWAMPGEEQVLVRNHKYRKAAQETVTQQDRYFRRPGTPDSPVATSRFGPGVPKFPGETLEDVTYLDYYERFVATKQPPKDRSKLPFVLDN